MKKIIYNIVASLCVFSAVSCGDMLEPESSRIIIDPSLGNKNDSVMYATGVLQSLQEIADQYFLVNELRGELIQTTRNTEEALKQIANYNINSNTTNKYDSVYKYYNVINNCNYYLENRDSAMYSGSTNVSRDEYISVAAIRSWTYLQLARLYEKVPYITNSLTTIESINEDKSVVLTGKEILVKEKEFLSNVLKHFYNGANNDAPLYSTTTFGTNRVDIGTPNWSSTSKNINPLHCFMPADVVLGDICLEMDEFDEAARHYMTYLNNEAVLNNNYLFAEPALEYKNNFNQESLPLDYSIYKSDTRKYLEDKSKSNNADNKPQNWYEIFSQTESPYDVITYIPMAVNYTRGKTTIVPSKFGIDYYGNARSNLSERNLIGSRPQIENIEIVPSIEYNTLADTAYFYYQNNKKEGMVTPISMSNMGDARSAVLSRCKTDTTLVFNEKVGNGNIYVYRLSTIYLRLAEALNRLGYPDLAFAILKDGLNSNLHNYLATPERSSNPAYYIKPASYDYLVALGNYRSSSSFDVRYRTSSPNKDDIVINTVGIHMHGCGMVDGIYSTYQYKNVVGVKLNHLAEKFGLDMSSPTLNDTINAVEDLICDEMAMELAFEGTRYSDLQRIAHHKNNAGLYRSEFGSLWLGKKLVSSGRKELTDENMFMDKKNWYLPFK